MTGTKVEAVTTATASDRLTASSSPRARLRAASRRRSPEGLPGRRRRRASGDDRLRRAERRVGTDGRGSPSPARRCPTGSSSRRAKLRGVVSEGMILAASELEIGAGSEGNRRARRADSRRRAGAGDPARGRPADRPPPCSSSRSRPTGRTGLGVFGRRARACTPRPPAHRPARGSRRSQWSLDDAGSEGPAAAAEVSVECPELCPRFTARVFEDVTVGPSPLWLQARLLAAGQRPITTSSTSPTTRCC